MSTLLLVLACAVFAQATSEFMLAGLVGEIAAEFDVPLGTAGSLTSAIAAGMVLGAPLMALAARRMPPRSALCGFLAVFVVVHVFGALTTDFALLLVTRVVAALANAGFLAVALGVAVRSVPSDRTARATAVLLSGTTLALIAGVPAGALIAQFGGWRSTFWVVAALAAVALTVLPLVAVPTPAAAARPSVRAETGVLRRPVVVSTLLVGVLVNGGTFAAYTYLGPLLTDAGGARPGLVPVALAVFGVGAFVGVSLAGRVADTSYRPLVLGGGAALLVGWVVMGLTSDSAVAVTGLAGMLGLVSFAVGSAVIARSLALVPDAPTLGGSFTTAALNLGATAGPLVGGAALAAGPTGPAWAAAGAVALAVVPVAVALRTDRDRRTAGRAHSVEGTPG